MKEKRKEDEEKENWRMTGKISSVYLGSFGLATAISPSLQDHDIVVGGLLVQDDDGEVRRETQG